MGGGEHGDDPPSAAVAQRLRELEAQVELLQRELLDRRDLETKLQATMAQLEGANRAKSVFLAQMSHELRTPLNAIIGFSEIMAAELFGQLNERYASYARDIQTSGQLLLDMIDEVLDLSRIEAGRDSPNEEVVDLRPIIEATVHLLEPRLRDKPLEVQVGVPQDLPLIRADSRMLKQILLNLLSNAVKFTPRGGRVEVGVAIAADRSVELHVHDTGVGIPEADMRRLYEPFQRGSNARREGIPGTGLGLTITRHMVEQHGGRIEIESQLGSGTRVRISLPPERVIG